MLWTFPFIEGPNPTCAIEFEWFGQTSAMMTLMVSDIMYFSGMLSPDYVLVAVLYDIF